MRILIKITDRFPEETPDELAMRLYDVVEEKYDTYAHDKESYVASYDENGAIARELDLVDGAVDPARIIAIANAWDHDVALTFDHALKAVIASAESRPNGPTAWLTADSTARYELKKAALALDNSFYDFAENVLLVNEHGYFETILREERRQAVVANPGDYACITVTTK